MKKILTAITIITALSSCGTVHDLVIKGSLTECQTKKSSLAQKRKIRPAAITFDLLPVITLNPFGFIIAGIYTAADFISGGIYKPCKIK